MNLLFFNVAAESPCGSWQAFKDEKCIRFLESAELCTFDEAEKYCAEAGNRSTILTINSKEEQDFISEFAFETHEIVDNIWLGMKRINNEYIWIDDSEPLFTNWATGSPMRKSDKNCVQITSDSNPIGKWVDVSCKKRNIVFCQKTQPVQHKIKNSKDKLLLDLKKELEDNRKQSERYNSKFEKFLENSSSNQWINFKLFSDNDGEKKAFFIPLADNTYGRNWTDAVELCANLSSTLVEIDSWQKSVIFRSYLAQLGSLGTSFKSFWVNGRRDLNRREKWEWVGSRKDVILKDWHSRYPVLVNDDYLAVTLESNMNFGKLFNPPKKSTSNVVCELNINF
jgi:hypothetical protein